MTKTELKKRLEAGETLNELLAFCAGQECEIYKADDFEPGDTVLYIPDISLNLIPIHRALDLEEIEEILEECFTGDDFIQECEGNVEKAESLFWYCDWQHPSAAVDELEDEEEEEYEDEDWDDEEDRPRRRPARRPARSKSSKPARSDGRRAGPFSGWGEEQWRRMELICIGVCAVLIIAIVVMFITGRKTGAAPAGGSAVPAAGQVTEATPEPELEPYPDDTVKAAIQASDIEVQPADLDYVKAATTATVTVGTGNKTLRLRSGPNTNYRQLAEMPNGTAVDVFAKKDDWALVLYQADDGPLYGWCSSSYLITTSGSVG